MGNHAFNVIVVLFWLATMGWLVVAKVLPPLRVGEPPNHSSVFVESHEQPTVCWSVRLQGRTIGWAATKIDHRKDGISELINRLYLAELPLEEVVPGWVGVVLKPLLGEFSSIDLDKTTRMIADPLGRPVGFETKVRVADIPDAIKVIGHVDGAMLRLTVQSGTVSYKMDTYLPPDGMMLDELSPQAKIAGLHAGQTWTIPMYSPLRPSKNPVEILQATVERFERMNWGDESVSGHIIVYRSDAGSAIAGNEPRGRAWVSEDGTVLRQEVTVVKSRLQFLRLSAAQGQPIIDALEEVEMKELPPHVSRQLVEQLAAEGT